MASITLRNVADRFPVGTVVGAYQPTGVLVQPEYLLKGTAIASGTVLPDGSLPFSGLSSDTPYVASDGLKTWRFQTPPDTSGSGGSVDTSGLDTRISALELALPSKLSAREEIAGGDVTDFVGSKWTVQWSGKVVRLIKRGQLTVNTVLDPRGLFPGAELWLYATQPAAGGKTITIPNQAGPVSQWLATDGGVTSLGRFVCPDGASLWLASAAVATSSSSPLSLTAGAYSYNVGS